MSNAARKRGVLPLVQDNIPLITCGLIVLLFMTVTNNDASYRRRYTVQNALGSVVLEELEQQQQQLLVSGDNDRDPLPPLKYKAVDAPQSPRSDVNHIPVEGSYPGAAEENPAAAPREEAAAHAEDAYAGTEDVDEANDGGREEHNADEGGEAAADDDIPDILKEADPQLSMPDAANSVSPPGEKATLQHNPGPDTLDAAKLLSSPIAMRMIVSEKLGLMYCPVPKVASTNWKWLLRKMEGFEDYRDLNILHDMRRNGLKYLKDFSAEQVREMINDERVIKFMFVRNPYMRLLSGFIDKFEKKKMDSPEFAHFFDQLLGIEFRALGGRLYRPTFANFSRIVANQEDRHMNEHWASMDFICQFEHFPYDFVGRFENYDEDAATLLKALRLKEKFPTQQEIGFLSLGADEKADMYLNDELKGILKKRFARDFELFQYDG